MRNGHDLTWHRDSELSQRPATISGAGIVTATALAASVSELERFGSARPFAVSLGLTPLQSCSGGKERLGRTSRIMGDRDLRRLLAVGLTSLIRRAKATPAPAGLRLPALLQFKPVRLGDHDPRRNLPRTGGHGRLTGRRGGFPGCEDDER